MVLPALPYDVLLCVFENCTDQITLHQCSLTSQEFNRAAQKLLYAKVSLYIRPKMFLDLRVRDTGLPNEPSSFLSAMLPRNQLLVQHLEIYGGLSTRPPPRNLLHSVLAEAIASFTNLQSITFTPWQCHETLFNEPLRLLSHKPKLSNVHVNQLCLNDVNVHLLSQLHGLRKLTIENPTRILLQLLIPGWLTDLSQSLVELHLLNNCGSITPGVLRSCVPHLQNIQALSIGLSYSLTDENLFSTIAQLHCLGALSLRYYLQLSSPNRFAPLPLLRSLTVQYSGVNDELQTLSLCKWVRKAISSSTNLNHLSLIDEDHIDDEYPDEYDPPLKYDALFQHLVTRHCQNLRELELSNAFVSVEGLKALCQRCTNLEVLSVSGGQGFLSTFIARSSTLLRLHTAIFNLYHLSSAQRRFSKDKALEVMRSAPVLRRLTINGQKWEGLWTSISWENVEFIVAEA